MKEEPKEYRNIDELIPWDKNPRGITDEGIKKLDEQIERLGQYKPFIITKDNIILGGNQRYHRYKAKGIKRVWVSVVNAPTDKDKLEYALSDNDPAGYYEQEQLASLVQSIPGFDVESFGIVTQVDDLGDVIAMFDEDSDQGDLDQFGPKKEVECPKCHHKFEV